MELTSTALPSVASSDRKPRGDFDLSRNSDLSLLASNVSCSSRTWASASSSRTVFSPSWRLDSWTTPRSSSISARRPSSASCRAWIRASDSSQSSQSSWSSLLACSISAFSYTLVFGDMTSVLHNTWYLIPKRLPVSRQDLKMRRWLAASSWLHNTRSTVGYLRLLAPADITEQLMLLNQGSQLVQKLN